MKNTAIVILVVVVVWMVLGMPTPTIDLGQYNGNTGTVVYSVPTNYPTTEPKISTIPAPFTPVPIPVTTAIVIAATQTPAVTTIYIEQSVLPPTPEYNLLTAQDYGIPLTLPLSSNQQFVCRNLFDNHIENTMLLAQQEVCKISLGLK